MTRSTASLRAALVEAESVSDETQKGERRHIAIERRPLGQIPDLALCLAPGTHNRMAIQHAHRQNQVRARLRNHPHGRRLAGTVLTEKAEHFAFLQTEAQAGDRNIFAKGLV